MKNPIISAATTAPKNGSTHNPYNNLNPHDQLSWFQRITDGLGFTNHAAAAQYAHQLNSQNWESQRALALEDREYNSEQQVAERMRAAGLNPDFQNVSGGASDLAGSAPTAPLAQPKLEQSISEIIPPLVSIVSGMASISNTIFSGDMANFTNAFSGAKSDLINDFLSVAQARGKSKETAQALARVIQGDAGAAAIVRDIVGDSSFAFANPMRSGKARKYLEDRINNYVASAQFRQDALAAMKDDYTTVKEEAKERGTVQGLQNGDKDLAEVFGILASATYDASLAAQRSSKEYSNKERQYNQTFDAIQAAETANAQNESAEQDANMQENKKQETAKLLDKLARASEKGNWAASIALILLNSTSAGTVANQASTAFGKAAGKAIVKSIF